MEDGRKFAFTPLLYSEIFKIYILLFFQVHGISQNNKNNRVHAKYETTITCEYNRVRKIDYATTYLP